MRTNYKYWFILLINARHTVYARARIIFTK